MKLTEVDQAIIRTAINLIRENIDSSFELELLVALQEIADRKHQPTQEEIEASWRENPDRMGGQFTEEELNRSGWL